MPAPEGNNYAAGNSGGGAPEGNQNAVGNSGGGAPEGNANAMIHGAYGDLDLLDDRLVGDAREHVDELTESIIENATPWRVRDDELPERARRLALLMYQESLAQADSLPEENGGRGIAFDDEYGPRVNPTLTRSLQIDREVHRDFHALGLFDD